MSLPKHSGPRGSLGLEWRGACLGAGPAGSQVFIMLAAKGLPTFAVDSTVLDKQQILGRAKLFEHVC